MITYTQHDTHISVRLDGKRVGEIRKVEGGFHYKPTGAPAGETMATVSAVRRSIEGRDENA